MLSRAASTALLTEERNLVKLTSLKFAGPPLPLPKISPLALATTAADLVPPQSMQR